MDNNIKLSKAQKSGNPINPAFTFWVENKTANKRQYFTSDLRLLFQKWLRTKEKEWLQYYNSEIVITNFLTSKDGINSTFDNAELPEIVRLLKPDYINATK